MVQSKPPKRSRKPGELVALGFALGAGIVTAMWFLSLRRMAVTCAT